jgi:hypothetical protein
MRIQNKNEKARLIQKLAAAKRAATPGTGAGATRTARPRFEIINACSDHDYHNHGLLGIDADEVENNN